MSESRRPAWFPQIGREARAGRFPGPSLIPELHAIQERHGWLPRDELVALARDRRRPLYEIEGLVSFYPHFRATGPPAKAEVAVCRDLSCWLRDAERHHGQIQSSFRDDPDVEVHRVSCLGRCDIAPAAAVNEIPVRAGEVETAVQQAKAGDLPEAEALRPDRRWPTDPHESPHDHYAVFRDLLRGTLEPAGVVETLKASNLRGMGGAGFPTGLKWELVAGEDDSPKYAIVNADESEPGTFKDRQILAELPHLVLEGLLLGMAVVGAESGFVFIRHEYEPERRIIENELERLTEIGLVGDDVLGSGRRFEIELFVSPGGYILGEETALIECMEGHRGEPRNKPPFPGTHGLWGKPTLMNSVETFADVPIILRRGAEWWRDQGVNGADGFKFLAVSGDVAEPGVYCVPLGTPVAELLELAGGVTGGGGLAGFQPGGASSNFLGSDRTDVPLDFQALQEAGSMLGSGALVAFAEGTDLRAAATNVLTFFRNESCGKCVPCRAGSQKAVVLLNEVLADGRGIEDVGDEIVELEEAMRLTSICGLGQVALGPVLSVLRMEKEPTAAP